MTSSSDTAGPHPRPVGVRQVADAAGVSTGTVSNVLNHPERVGAATRERVEAAMAGLWPLLVLWRDPNPGVNVLGVEPSTSRDGGRAGAERDGEVVYLAPGQSRKYRTRLWLEPTTER